MNSNNDPGVVIPRNVSTPFANSLLISIWHFFLQKSQPDNVNYLIIGGLQLDIWICIIRLSIRGVTVEVGHFCWLSPSSDFSIIECYVELLNSFLNFIKYLLEFFI